MIVFFFRFSNCHSKVFKGKRIPILTTPRMIRKRWCSAVGAVWSCAWFPSWMRWETQELPMDTYRMCLEDGVFVSGTFPVYEELVSERYFNKLYTPWKSKPKAGNLME